MESSGGALLTDALWADDVLLPHRPYATNYLDRGQYRMSRSDALAMRYIEHSPHALLGSIVVDCDHPDAALRAFEKPSDHPAPNWVAQSPSGRAHIGWWLSAAVCRTNSARLQPLRYAHRVEAGLRNSVGGDFAYGGQLTKNPIHPDWETLYGPSTPYELRELITIHTPRQSPRRPDRAAGLGRNVTMFDTARRWAYPQWWHHRHGTIDQWLQLVLQRCHAVNTEFADPLPFVEVRATAQSIGKWIWRNFDEENYRARQAERGRRGGKVVTPAKIEANRRRATKFDLATALELAL
ncbi:MULTISPECIES: replication initiation protein [unclassified Rhodococcus (in: high G+C Gram-positive bacteria)]|uniref:replication initiation protein n=1 Tax=unclassified Rhodococcus (in: high G+C Gram-positive bacteria) TaxID=192944 RepID=UPI003140140D